MTSFAASPLGMRAYLVGALSAVAMAVGLGGCGSEECIVLSNGGNKLCGADAAAWCESTDGLRQEAIDSGFDTSTADLRTAQDNCREIEDEYGS